MAKIAIYHPWIHLKGGGEKVILELLKRSEHEIEVFTHHFNLDNTFEELEVYEDRINVLSDLGVEGQLTRGLRYAFAEMKEKIDLEGFDVLMTSVGDIGELILTRNSADYNLGYCHSLRATYDPESVVEEKSFLERQVYKTLIWGFSMVERLVWRRLDRVYANSDYTRERIVDSGLKDEEGVGVIHPGIEMQGRAEKGDYLFYPGRINRTKQQLEAVEVVEEVRDKGFDMDLKLAGAVDKETDYVQEVREEAGEKDWLSLEENVSDERMEELYRYSHTVLFLGRKEDWGLIPVEAMSYGKPVVSLNEGGPKEQVVDGETGYLCNVSEMPDNVIQLLKEDELYDTFSRKSHERAKKFTWNSFVKKFDQEVNELVGS